MDTAMFLYCIKKCLSEYCRTENNDKIEMVKYELRDMQIRMLTDY